VRALIVFSLDAPSKPIHRYYPHRFGKLCWRELSDSIPLPEMKGFDVRRFIQMAFETDKKNSRFFYTKYACSVLNL
jgi:hypothetical protein